MKQTFKWCGGFILWLLAPYLWASEIQVGFGAGYTFFDSQPSNYQTILEQSGIQFQRADSPIPFRLSARFQVAETPYLRNLYVDAGFNYLGQTKTEASVPGDMDIAISQSYYFFYSGLSYFLNLHDAFRVYLSGGFYFVNATDRLQLDKEIPVSRDVYLLASSVLRTFGGVGFQVDMARNWRLQLQFDIYDRFPSNEVAVRPSAPGGGNLPVDLEFGGTSAMTAILSLIYTLG